MSLGDCLGDCLAGIVLGVIFGVFLDTLLGVSAGWPARRLAAKSKSGIFLSKWHKKVAGLRGKHLQQVTAITVQGI
jgi:hypothetical protein